MKPDKDDIYSRNYPYINLEEQERIGKLKIAVFGAGLSSYAVEALARIGIKNISVYDHDYVELSNLNRQNYYDEDVSNWKVAALRSRIDFAVIGSSIEKITTDNYKDIIDDHDIVINTIDYDDSEIAFKVLEYCVKTNTDVYELVNLGWEGFSIPVNGYNLHRFKSMDTMLNYLIPATEMGIEYYQDIKDILDKENIEWLPQLVIGSMDCARRVVFQIVAKEIIL